MAVKHHRNKRLFKRMHNKLLFTFVIICILFVALILRLMYIQYTSGEKYQRIILAQQTTLNTKIPPQRGDVIDSKGNVVATSIDVYNVILDAFVLNQYPERVDSTLDYVREIFPEVSTDEIKRILEEDPESRYSILAKGVSYDSITRYNEIENDEETTDEVAGIWFEKDYKRIYPYNSAAGSVIGFATAEQGVIGIESEYNDTLTGTYGRSYGYIGNDNDLEETTIDPIDGNNVVLTIDMNIQTIVEKALADGNARIAEQGAQEGINGGVVTSGSERSAAIVMNPNNGEIMAMASTPGFDLNNPRDLSAYYTEEELAVMPEDQQMDILNSIWQNYAITNSFEPGSTFKPFVEAMGLDSGALAGDETYFCDGSETVGGWQIHCVNRDGHGTESIKQALENSCNDAMMQMGYAIGPQKFSKYFQEYGFGQKTGIDLPGEASTKSLVFSEEELTETPTNMAVSTFGQGFNVTMIQLCSSYCSLINGGNYYRPHVVKQVTDRAGNVISQTNPVVVKKTVSAEISDTLVDYMYGVVEEGTGFRAELDNYTLGGKTGTAQKYPREENNYVISFIGFAPVSNPQAVVFVLFDTPSVSDQSKCAESSVVAKDIMTQILPYLNIDQDKASEVTEPVPEAPTEQNNTQTTGEQQAQATQEQPEAQQATQDVTVPDTPVEQPAQTQPETPAQSDPATVPEQYSGDESTE